MKLIPQLQVARSELFIYHGHGSAISIVGPEKDSQHPRRRAAAADPPMRCLASRLPADAAFSLSISGTLRRQTSDGEGCCVVHKCHLCGPTISLNIFMESSFESEDLRRSSAN